jgi:hypothetical protein
MPDETEILTYTEVLELLSRKAQDGSVTAMAALERALRLREDDGRDEVAETIDRILDQDD